MIFRKTLLFMVLICMAAGAVSCGGEDANVAVTPYPNDPNTYPAGRIPIGEIATVKMPYETMAMTQDLVSPQNDKSIKMTYFISQEEDKNDFYLISTSIYSEDVFTMMTDEEFAALLENILLQMMDNQISNVQTKTLKLKDVIYYKALEVICDAGTHPIIVHSYGIKNTLAVMVGASQDGTDPNMLKGALETFKLFE